MDHNQKMKFVVALHKHSLQALDTGGGVIGNNTAGALNTPVNNNPVANGVTFGLSGNAGNIVQGGENVVGGAAQGLASALTAQNTFQAQAPTSAATVGTQQAGLASELQNEAAGNGPNPAQQQYLQNTGNIAQQQAQNYAQNRALNPGLAARQAGNTAANVQQTAAGTAGIQQAQQQIGAQSQLQGLTGQEQQGALYAQGLNAQTSQNNTNSVNQTEGGLLGGGASALESLLAKGGVVKKMDTGGAVPMPNLSDDDAVSSYDGFGGSGGSKGGSGGGGAGIGALAALLSKGGKVPSSHVGKFLSSSQKSVSKKEIPMGPGMLVQQPGPASLMTSGGKVAAQNSKEKAVKSGDSLKNDKVPTLLSENEIVIPRHITMGANAPQKAAAFVQAVLNKRKMSKGASA
jgi:hypothetical protein